MSIFWDAMWARLGWELVPILILGGLIGFFAAGIVILCAVQSAMKWIIGRHLGW